MQTKVVLTFRQKMLQEFTKTFLTRQKLKTLVIRKKILTNVEMKLKIFL